MRINRTKITSDIMYHAEDPAISAGPPEDIDEECSPEEDAEIDAMESAREARYERDNEKY